MVGGILKVELLLLWESKLTNAGAGSIVVGVGGSVGAGVLLVFRSAASRLVVLGAAGVHRARIASTLCVKNIKFYRALLQLQCMKEASTY